MTQRGHRIVLLAHCILNVNARVQGLGRYAGIHPLVGELASRGVGVIQLPCPELDADSLSRPPRAIEDYDTREFRGSCAEHAEETAELVRRYQEAGVEVLAFVGVEGSPSCGVTITNTEHGAPEGEVSVRVAGSGVLVQELRRRLEPLGVAFVGVDGRVSDLGVDSVLTSLGLVTPES